MRIRSTPWLWLLALLWPAVLGAQAVLLLSTGDSKLDLDTKAVLQAGGATVTIGSPYPTFSSAELSGINVVLLFPNHNWASGDMSLAAQTALVNFINSGGGLVTAEWTNWKVGAGSFQTLQAALPVVSTTQYTGGAGITYTQSSPHAGLNTGMPSAFTFTADNFAGVESYFTAKSTATVYYASSGGANGAGLVGWQYGNGRVMQFSTTAGSLSLADANFARLLQNTVKWAAVPEPGTLFLLVIGLGVLLGGAARRHRRP